MNSWLGESLMSLDWASLILVSAQLISLWLFLGLICVMSLETCTGRSLYKDLDGIWPVVGAMASGPLVALVYLATNGSDAVRGIISYVTKIPPTIYQGLFVPFKLLEKSGDE